MGGWVVVGGVVGVKATGGWCGCGCGWGMGKLCAFAFLGGGGMGGWICVWSCVDEAEGGRTRAGLGIGDG